MVHAEAYMHDANSGVAVKMLSQGLLYVTLRNLDHRAENDVLAIQP